MVDEEVRRFARLLESVVRVSKVSVREIERRLDLGGGSLNRVFKGRIELKMRHILGVLDVLGLDAREFFETAYRASGTPSNPGATLLPDPRLEKLLGLLDLVSARPEPPADGAGGISLAELDRHIAEALRRHGYGPRKGRAARSGGTAPLQPASPPKDPPPRKRRPRDKPGT